MHIEEEENQEKNANTFFQKFLLKDSLRENISKVTSRELSPFIEKKHHREKIWRFSYNSSDSTMKNMLSTRSSTTKFTNKDLTISPSSSPRAFVKFLNHPSSHQLEFNRNTREPSGSERILTENLESRILSPVPRFRLSRTSENSQRISKLRGRAE